MPVPAIGQDKRRDAKKHCLAKAVIAAVMDEKVRLFDDRWLGKPRSQKHIIRHMMLGVQPTPDIHDEPRGDSRKDPDHPVDQTGNNQAQ